ncbi:MAG: MFS transporter [Nanoarchaeota archaeon]|nr:MFS transporter [Nanoarchaeota archaeon]
MVNKLEEIKLKKRSRKRSIKEGIFAAARTSFGDYYVSPFAIAINASNSMVALLSSIAGLLGPLSQVFGSKLIEKHPRKKILSKSVSIEILMWIPFIAISILYYKGLLLEILPLFLLIAFACFTIFQNAGHPAWFSWVGDLVDEKHRGRWFAKRNLLIGFVSIVLAIIASFLLDYFKNKGLIMFGFVTLFSLALIMRFMSWKELRKQYEPKIKIKKKDSFSFLEFIINAPKNNFGKFALFRASISFSAAICAPLIAVYLLRNLSFSYKEYILITLGGTFISLFFLELWGKFADKYGNYRTIIIASILIPLEPLLWVLHYSIWYLLFVPALISGIAWAGLQLSAGNFIYDSVSPQKRGAAVSYFNMLWGIGVFLGAGLGALLINFLNTEIVTPIVAIFIISAIARAIAAILWLPRIKEIRKTQRFRGETVFKHLLFKDAKPTIIKEVHEIMTIKNYFHLK